jgi:hypothetical protein
MGANWVRMRQAVGAMPLPELTVFGMMLGSGKEIWHFMRAFKSLESFVYVARRLSLHALGRAAVLAAA